MIHLVYVSSATREMSEDELLELLEQSRHRNEQQEVTGMLLYAGGNFFQVLEGAEKDVREIYQAIENDPRNTGNIVILTEPIEQRTFPEWSMGFRHLTGKDRSAIAGYTEFLDREMEPGEFADKQGEVLDLLYMFRKTNP